MTAFFGYSVADISSISRFLLCNLLPAGSKWHNLKRHDWQTIFSGIRKIFYKGFIVLLVFCFFPAFSKLRFSCGILKILNFSNRSKDAWEFRRDHYSIGESAQKSHGFWKSSLPWAAVFRTTESCNFFGALIVDFFFIFGCFYLRYSEKVVNIPWPWER